MIFSCKKIRNRSPTLSQVVHFHPSIQWLFWGPKKHPVASYSFKPYPPQLEGPSCWFNRHSSAPSLVLRQGTLRLRQNRPRSRELRLRCYDLLSYTTPGVLQSSKNFFGRKIGEKRGDWNSLPEKNIKLSRKKNKTHWKKTPLPKKNSSSWSKLIFFLGGGTVLSGVGWSKNFKVQLILEWSPHSWRWWKTPKKTRAWNDDISDISFSRS